MVRQIAHCLSHEAESETLWPEHVQKVAWTWNTQVKDTRSRSPFEILFGQLPWFPLDNQTGRPGYESDDLTQVNDHRIALLAGLCNQVQQQITDEHEISIRPQDRKPRHYQIGDLVLLHNSKLEKQWSGKFRICWSGPFTVSAVRPGGAYVLSVISGNNAELAFKGRPVNHLRLRPYRSRTTAGILA